MIKFAADIVDKNDGEKATLIGIGITREDIEGMISGEPILFKTDALNVRFENGGGEIKTGMIFIMTGESDEQIMNEFRESGLLQI